jgi:hypothetical protein
VFNCSEAGIAPKTFPQTRMQEQLWAVRFSTAVGLAAGIDLLPTSLVIGLAIYRFLL